MAVLSTRRLHGTSPGATVHAVWRPSRLSFNRDPKEAVTSGVATCDISSPAASGGERVSPETRSPAAPSESRLNEEIDILSTLPTRAKTGVHPDDTQSGVQRGRPDSARRRPDPLFGGDCLPGTGAGTHLSLGNDFLERLWFSVGRNKHRAVPAKTPALPELRGACSGLLANLMRSNDQPRIRDRLPPGKCVPAPQ